MLCLYWKCFSCIFQFCMSHHVEQVCPILINLAAYTALVLACVSPMSYRRPKRIFTLQVPAFTTVRMSSNSWFCFGSGYKLVKHPDLLSSLTKQILY